MSIDGFERLAAIHKEKMMAKQHKIKKLSKGDGGVAMQFFDQAVKTMAEDAESVGLLAKYIPTKSVFDAYQRMEMARLDFLQEFADGMIEIIKIKKGTGK